MVPFNAQAVWMGYSPSKWTERLRQQCYDAAWRQKGLRKFTVGSKGQPYTLEIADLPKQVAEYAPGKQVKRGMEFSVFEFESRHENHQTLQMMCGSTGQGKAMAVILDDPMAIVQDLAYTINARVQSYQNDPKVKTPLGVYTLIDQMRSQFTEQAEIKAIEGAQIRATVRGRLPHPRSREILQNLVVPKKEIDDAKADAWKKYEECYQSDLAEKWNTSYQDGMKLLDEKVVQPLAKAHAAWLIHADLHKAFEANHDNQDCSSGLAYATNFYMCIAGTTDKGASAAQYHQWINGDIGDSKNLLLRAIGMNHEQLITGIKKMTEISIDKRTLPNDALIGLFASTVKQAVEKESKVMPRLLTELLGPMTSHMIETKADLLRPVFVLIGLYTDKQLIKIHVKGTRAEFIKMVTNVLKASLVQSGVRVSDPQINNVIDQQIKRLNLGGVDMAGQVEKEFVTMIDKGKLNELPKSVKSQDLKNWAAKAMVTVGEAEAMQAAHWKMNKDAAAKQVGKGAPIIAGVLGLILQGLAVQKATEDLGKAAPEDVKEAKSRLMAMYTICVGTVLDVTGSAMAWLVDAKLISKMAMKSYGQAISWMGKFLGIAGALILGIWDFTLGVKSWNMNKGLAICYFISSISGVLAAVFVALEMTGVGLVAVAIFFIVTIVIEYVKGEQLKDWLRKCFWGKGSDRFKTLEDHFKQLKAITAD